MIRFLEAYFHMALVASIVTILILLIRPIFKKFSNRIACLLWAVVFFRLLCPFTIERPAILNGDRYEPALAKSVDTSVDSMQNTEIADRFGGTALHSNEEMELPAYRLNASGKESASNRQSVAVTDQRITGNVTAGSVSGSDRDIKQNENRRNNIFQNAGSGSGLTDENDRRAGSLSGADIEEDSETAAKGLLTGKAEDEAETTMMEKDQKLSVTKQQEQNQKVSITEQLEQDQTLSTAEQSKSKTWTTIASVMEGMKRAGVTISQVSQRFFQSRIGGLTALICGVIWFAGMILFGILGVLKYYFTVRKLRASEPFKIRKNYEENDDDAVYGNSCPGSKCTERDWSAYPAAQAWY